MELLNEWLSGCDVREGEHGRGGDGDAELAIAEVGDIVIELVEQLLQYRSDYLVQSEPDEAQIETILMICL